MNMRAYSLRWLLGGWVLILLAGCQSLLPGQPPALPSPLPTLTPANTAAAPEAPSASPTPADAVASSTPAAWPTPANDAGMGSEEDGWWWFPAEGVDSLRLRYQLIVQSPRHENGAPWTYALIEGEAQRVPTPLAHWVVYQKGEVQLELYATPNEVYFKDADGEGWVYLQGEEGSLLYSTLALGPALDRTYALFAPTIGQDQGETEINGLPARHYTWSLTPDQFPSDMLVPYQGDILFDLGLEDAQVQVVSFQGDIYLARDGGWPIKQVLTWDLQATVNGQAEPLRVQAIYEVYDINADLNLQIPAEVQQEQAQPPIPLPPGSRNMVSMLGGASSGWIYALDTTYEALLAFWQDQGVQILQQQGSLDMGGMLLQVRYQDATYQVMLQPGENGGLTLILSPSE